MAPRSLRNKTKTTAKPQPERSAPRTAKKVKGPAEATQVVIERRQKVGQVFVVGQGDVGQLGLGPDTLEKTRFAPILGLENVVDVVAGGMHTLCLTADGLVWSFGCNDEGALGRPTSSLEVSSETTPGQVQLPEPIAKLSAGDSHSVALGVSGTVYMWGNFRDSTGQVGLVTEGKAAQEPKQVATNIVQVASGSDHVAMLTADGEILTMGCPEQGQLGRLASYFAARGSRRPVSLLITPTKVPMRRIKGVKSMAFDAVWAGAYTTIARQQQTGQLFCWGLNNYSQLGSFGGRDNAGDIIYHPKPMSCSSGQGWKLVSGGQHHTMLLSEKGEVFALGRKEYGRLGLGTLTPADGEDQKTPAQVPGLSACMDISCGEATSHAIDEQGRLFSWGIGSNNQLGHADGEDKFEPQVVAGRLADQRAVLVSGGGQHTVILVAPPE